MDVQIAREYLTNPTERKASEIGQAVDVFYMKYHSYQAISNQLNMSPKFLSSRHKIFQLPKGIRWKVDQKQIKIEQGLQISKLKNEDDQWLLAFVIIEEKLSVKECKDIVNIVHKQNISIRNALRTSTGVRFDKIQPLILPLRFEIRLAISHAAWSQYKNWEDLCYQLIRQGINIDIQEVSIQLDKLASALRKSGREKTK